MPLPITMRFASKTSRSTLSNVFTGWVIIAGELTVDATGNANTVNRRGLYPNACYFALGALVNDRLPARSLPERAKV